MNPVWSAMSPVDLAFAADRVAVSARGHRVRFADGSERLCATSGLWNVPLGYGHPGVADAVAVALRDASYLTLFRGVHRPAQDAAAALLDLAGSDRYGRVIFSTSGGAANDVVMKLARQFQIERGEPARTLVVGLRGSYHGTMYGSHALSGDALGQAAYALDRRAVRHVDATDPGELTALLVREGARVAAVVIEPVLGTGAHPVSEALVEATLEARDEHGFLVVADEVATGFGRTGPLFASGEWSRSPDLLVLSKALTNGAIGAAAVLVGPRVVSAFTDRRATFVHGETQAGTPAVAAAILAFIDEFRRPEVRAAAQRTATGTRELADALVRDGLAVEVRGRGAFLAVALADAGGTRLSPGQIPDAIAAIAAAGAIVHPGVDGIQLIPGYGYGDGAFAELDAAIRAGLAHMAEVAG
ncbi:MULTISPECIES: daptide-type RiPP biosynthesis aminotransferase [Microbacterium]|uniref:daptide-type RiPP biosynthesis aminotransferase n=1 Tax=Microbacterium TaxID=33882 RepID=UPI0027885862|nr:MULTISPECIES: daptide-type RiPP biosynthesis aminotransferase [Microbacterium]MDQ1074116.1 adenosylmethionine-8-amino-7-oxononanoate aminotransferase [Microbacterium sp. SORGH_AS_0969]MDQ1114342.1 adenosylmethionine-8-amino-7-oxononanoate aminotransferase [Microbacterium testaceum]